MRKQYFIRNVCLQFLVLLGSVLGCGDSKPTNFTKLAPEAKLPNVEQLILGLDGEHEYLQRAIGENLADLALCGELQARLQAIYWELFLGPDESFLSSEIEIDKKIDLIRESGVLEGQLLDVSERCSSAYSGLLANSTNSNANLVEVPAILKFLSNLVNFSNTSEEQLKSFYNSLNDSEKENLFQAVRLGHARYKDKIAVFGQTSDEFGVNLLTGKLKNEALAILKIANTGDNDNGNGFSKVFWDKAQENKQLPIDLSLKVGVAMIRDGADVLIDVATGSGLSEFGKGVKHAKDIIEKVDKADSFLDQAYSEIQSFYETRIKGFFNGSRRGENLKYTSQEYIDFNGNISITPNGVVQVKNYRGLAASDLRAKISFTNASEVDSIVLIHEFKDGRRSVQVVTQAAGGTVPADLYIPSSDLLSDNATTIIAIKRDPAAGSLKYTSTSARFSKGQSATFTLEVPVVSSPESDTASGDSQSICLITPKGVSGTVCLDFAQGSNSGSDASSAAKSFCSEVQGNTVYDSATLASSCPKSEKIKTCLSSTYKATFYSSDANQANNITCSAAGDWLWGS